MAKASFQISTKKKVSLLDFDPDYTGKFEDQKDAEQKLSEGIKRLAELQELLYAQGKQALLLIFQGMDTSGKDGMIKHVMSGVNPQGCEVHSFKQPSMEELDHDYLWRHAKVLPPRGKIGIFNRSYYEELTVTRVHKEILERQKLPPLKKADLWTQRHEQINNFEKYLVENGTAVLKFFLYISKDEQKNRLMKRLSIKEKHWKFNVSDIRERQFWHSYMAAYEDIFSHTGTSYAPWYIIPANHKWSARVEIANAIVAKLESLKLKFPKLTPKGEKNLLVARTQLK